MSNTTLFKHLLLNVLYNFKTTDDALNFMLINTKCHDVCYMVKLTPTFIDSNNPLDEKNKPGVKTTRKLLRLFPNIETINVHSHHHIAYLYDDLLTHNIAIRFDVVALTLSLLSIIRQLNVTHIDTIDTDQSVLATLSNFHSIRTCKFIWSDNTNPTQLEDFINTRNIDPVIFRCDLYSLHEIIDTVNRIISQRSVVVKVVQNSMESVDLSNFFQQINSEVVFSVNRAISPNDQHGPQHRNVYTNHPHQVVFNWYSTQFEKLNDDYLFSNVAFCNIKLHSDQVLELQHSLALSCTELLLHRVSCPDNVSISLSTNITKLQLAHIRNFSISNMSSLNLLDCEIDRYQTAIAVLPATITRLTLNEVDVSSLDYARFPLKEIDLYFIDNVQIPEISTLTRIHVNDIDHITIPASNNIIHAIIEDCEHVKGICNLTKATSLVLDSVRFEANDLEQLTQLVHLELYTPWVKPKNWKIVLPTSLQSLRICYDHDKYFANFDKINLQSLHLWNCGNHNVTLQTTLTYLQLEDFGILNWNGFTVNNLNNLNIPLKQKQMIMAK